MIMHKSIYPTTSSPQIHLIMHIDGPYCMYIVNDIMSNEKNWNKKNVTLDRNLNQAVTFTP